MLPNPDPSYILIKYSNPTILFGKTIDASLSSKLVSLIPGPRGTNCPEIRAGIASEGHGAQGGM